MGSQLHRLSVWMLLLALAGCGGGAGGSSTSFERVRFPASDGVRLDGRLYGEGSVGVVLSHMGRGGDTQLDWSGLARDLSSRGYAVLTYDRRGVCPGGTGGCSHGSDDYADSWRDVVGAARYLAGRGIRRTVIAGASIGAMASLHAVARGHVHPAGIIEFGGINHASGYDFSRADIRHIAAPKLFLSSRRDIYGGGEAAREWFRWASPPRWLELVPGTQHGTDLLRADNPLRDRVQRIIVSFIERAAPPS